MLYNPTKTKILLALYWLYLIVATLITHASSRSSPLFTHYKLGKIMGVLGLSMLVIQFVLSSRFRWLERGVGLDRIMRWHSSNARLLVLALLLHPTIMFYPLILSGLSLVALEKSFTIFHILGQIALGLILFTVFITIYSKKLKLNYEHWKIIHKVAYVIIILGFIHSFFNGSDIVARQPLYWWWILLALATSISVIHRYIFRKNSWYTITKIVQENRDVRSIYMKLKDGSPMIYLPGQFAFVRFYAQNLSTEEHHFTLSSSPTQSELSFTIKDSGDFTHQLAKVTIGDRALLEGPFGVFSNVGMTGPFLFIAGGIGITPFISMLRYMRDLDLAEPVTLLYANKTSQDMIFQEELAAMSPWLKVVSIFSEEKIDGAYQGFVTQQVIKKELKDITNASIFLCGPPAMMAAVQKILRELRVPRQKIFTEHFALR